MPALEWNSRLSSSAGRFCPGSRNPLFPRHPKIEIAAYLKKLPDGDMHIRDTMLHEMVHYVLWHRFRPYGHTPEFHQILKRVGARRYNPVPNLKPAKHWYKCPACEKVIATRRAIKNSACLACCKRFSGGKYAEKFRLVPAPKPNHLPSASYAVTSASPTEEVVPLPVNEVIRKLEELKKMLTRA